jgi:hypothetical protein
VRVYTFANLLPRGGYKSLILLTTFETRSFESIPFEITKPKISTMISLHLHGVASSEESNTWVKNVDKEVVMSLAGASRF